MYLSNFSQVKTALEGCLSEESKAYFYPPSSSSSLLLLIHSCYWGSLAPLHLPLADLRGPLLLALPLLLPQEWSHLLPLLAQEEGGLQGALHLVTGKQEV